MIDDKFERWLASYLSGIMGLAEVTVIREPRRANPPKRGWHFAIVNMERQALLSEGHAILPGEMPQTYPTLEEAMEEVVRLHVEFDHNVETARIFQLVQMDLNEMDALFDEVFETYVNEQGGGTDHE